MIMPRSQHTVRLKPRYFALTAIGLAFALHAAPATAQNTCKGLAKSKCESSSSCSWVSGYKTKSGTAVKSYCRTSPGKGAAKKDAAKKKSAAAKSKASEKAKAAKAKASDESKAMTTKSKSQSVKAKAKADKATKADRKASIAAKKAAKDAAKKAKTQ